MDFHAFSAVIGVKCSRNDKMNVSVYEHLYELLWKVKPNDVFCPVV